MSRGLSVSEKSPCVKMTSLETARVPKPKLQSGGNDGLLAGGRAGLDQVLIQQVLKLRAPGFEARRVGIRDIVRDVFHIGLLRVHAAGGAKQCSYHFFISSVTCARLNLRHFFDGLFPHVVGNRDGLLHHFELAHQAHDAHRSMRSAHVGRFDLSLINLRAGRVHRILGRVVSENSCCLAW